MNESGQNLDVLYVITKSNWGGAQKHVHDLALAAKEKFSVAVASGEKGMLAHKLEHAGIPFYEIGALARDISFGKEAKALIDLFRLFRRLRPSVVHLHSPKAGGLGAFAAQIAGVPHVIYTSHGLPFEEDRPWWQKALIIFFTWLTFFLSDTVILITEANLQKARKMPWLGRRFRLIRSGIRPVRALSRTDARQRLKDVCRINDATADATWIGTIAEYHPVKGLEYLIRGVALLRKTHPDIICVLIGGGQEEKRLRDVIEECDLTRHVFLSGFIDNAAEYLSAFDVVTLTSVKEGLPYVVLEAGSVGAGFVGSAISSIEEIVTDMSSGVLVRPKRPKEIAGALALLVEDPARRTAYGKRLKERVDADFAADRMLAETLDLYTNLSPRPGRQEGPQRIG